MVWKPAQKKITKQEVIELAKAEISRYWFNASTPLFAAAKSKSEKSSLFPLDDAFTKKNWLLLFLDPLDLNFIFYKNIFKEWEKRYERIGVGFIYVFKSDFSLCSTSGKVKLYIPHYFKTTPFVIDGDGLISKTFSISHKNFVVLFAKGEQVFSSVSLSKDPYWYKEVENQIQKYIWSEQSGLPMPLIFESEEVLLKSHKIFECAMKKNEFKATLSEDKVSFEGNRSLIAENIEIKIPVESSEFFILVQNISKEDSLSKIQIKLDGISASEKHISDDVIVDPTGGTLLGVEEFKLYNVLTGLPENKFKTLTLSFLNAKNFPIHLYGWTWAKPEAS